MRTRGIRTEPFAPCRSPGVDAYCGRPGLTSHRRSLSRPDRPRAPPRPHREWARDRPEDPTATGPRVAARLDRCQFRNSPRAEKKMRGAANWSDADRRLSIERLFCWRPNEERLPQGDRRRGAARRRGDRDAADLAGRLPGAGALAAEPLRPRVRPRGPRRLPRRRRPDPDDEHVGRQPRQADRRTSGPTRSRRSTARACAWPARPPPASSSSSRARSGRSARSSSRTDRSSSRRCARSSRSRRASCSSPASTSILLETFGSLLEAAEAVRAVRGLSAEIPIVAEMTFLADGRTAFGESARRTRSRRSRSPAPTWSA